MKRALALALALGCLSLPGGAEASTLPAGRLFGLQCVKSSTDPYPCEVALTPALGGGEAVAASPNGNFVWAGGADGVLWEFRRVTAGRVAPVAVTHLASVDALAASRDGRDLYAVDTGSGGSGTLHVLHVGAGGRLTDGGCFDQGSVCGAGNTVPALANASDVAVSGDGQNVYVAAGFGTDAVSIFNRTPGGALTYAGCIGDSAATCGAGNTAPGLAGAHGLDVSPLGGSVYVAATGANFGGAADGTVAALRRNADGSLTANGCVEHTGAPPPCSSSGPDLVDPWEVETSRNAVYVVSRDGLTGPQASVATLARSGGGTISYRSCYAFTGSAQCGAGRAIPGIDGAFDIAISPDERTVHTTALGGVSQRGAVATFTRAATGVLSPAGCLGQSGSPETGCARTRVLESGGEAIDVAPDGANVYAGTGAGLAVLGREVAPACLNASVVVPGKAGSIPVPCFDLNGDALTHAAVAGPAHGDLGDFDDPVNTVRYKPEPGYVGPDFLTFRAQDGSLASNVARLTMDVKNARPSVTRLRLSRKRFRRGRRLPRASRRAKVGTTIRFRLSEPARLTLSFERRRGRRYRKVRTTIRVRGDTGGNSVRFQGRLSRRKRLGPGSYRLTVVAKDKQGLRSRRKRVRFRLVR